MMRTRIQRPGSAATVFGVTCSLWVAAGVLGCEEDTKPEQEKAAVTEKPSPKPKEQKKPQEPSLEQIQKLAPQRGYLKAHREAEPQKLLGGPIEVTVEQTEGGAHVALPDNRKLDTHVFGTPQLPRAYGGTPGINGLPPKLRKVSGETFSTMKKKSPFGDKHVVMGGGKLQLQLTDATAADASSTEDSAKMKATWKDEDGNTYEVRCCKKVLAHGLEFPTFGGVVTNHMMHGWTRVGTALMPTMYSYAAFWGIGEVVKNDKTLDKPRVVHGMLTEYVRTEDYKLASDDEVTPGRKHFHVMVAPFKPNPGKGVFEKAPVKTGFELPNGKQLPFWHVMFGNLDIESQRG